MKRKMGKTIQGLLLLTLAACGGGGGGDSSNSSAAPIWTQNVYPSSATYAAQCAAPRSGINPLTNAAYADTQGSVLLENFWLRSYMHELYLWYADVADVSPVGYANTEDYFETRLSPVILSSGSYKDSFSFAMPTSEWIAYAQSGVSAEYGVKWVVVSDIPPRNVRAAYVEPGSPAAIAGIERGDKVLYVDGVSIDATTQAQVDTLNAGLWPSATGQSHTFQLLTLTSAYRPVSMTSANVTSTPVLQSQIINTYAGNVGYVLFNRHIATAESQLWSAFQQFQTSNVTDLVLDLRYNGGGFLDIASEVAYMIAGSQATSNKVFERIAFNNQYAANVNPVTGGSNTPTPFHATTQGFSLASGQALPQLNLSRVFVITSGSTCSASESIINGLRGIGIEVIQIGGATCGKPYGFYATDNCGTTYFPVEFQGVNDVGFGDYAEGFIPYNSSSYLGYRIPGCSVADDFTQPLGSTTENGLEAALFYRSNGSCSLAIATQERRQVLLQAGDSEPLTPPDEPWRDARILNFPAQ